MDEVFLKSAIPASADSFFLLDDTTLALPSKPGNIASVKGDSKERSLRVQQQVQLTLARKARRTLSNGGVHLQRSTAQSFDTADGYVTNIKLNGYNKYPLSNNYMRKPSRRVEVSPPQSPGSPRSRFNYSSLRFGNQTHPGFSYPPRTGPVQDHMYTPDSFQRYAFSEAVRGNRAQVSTTAQGSIHQRSLRQIPAPLPAFRNAGYQQSVDYYGSPWSHNQTLTRRHTALERSADVALGGVRPEDGVSWSAQIRRNAHALRRLNSYPPTATSLEVDMGRPMDVELPLHQVQSQNSSTVKLDNNVPEMTLERAVHLLTQDNEETLVCAAGHIQNQCFKSIEAKKMVFYLQGIGKLLQLLHIDNEEVQRMAAGALRNIVYQNNENKMEVKENNGMDLILSALKSSRDVETRRQLTGLLWNLSSHDLLKECLSKKSLFVLTKYVLVPSSGISEGENPKDELLADDEVFHNATGCLRNLSSAGPDSRKAMRHCEDLIDSLVYYIRGTIADYKTDDKSTENCVCILHNLSYQMEAELPKKHAKDLRESWQNLASNHKTVSCFPQRNARIPEHLERQSPLLEEKANPRGVEWLWSPITIRMYLSLIARSVRHYTQEAAVGALQNITAGNGPVSEAIAFTIVQRENGLQHMQKILQEGESDVKKMAVSLIKNLSRHQELHSDIVGQVLPEVVMMLPNDDTGTDQPTDVTACLCHVLTNLSQSNSQHVRAIVNQGALPKIINISTRDNGYGPSRAGQSACLLLHTMWKHTDLHSSYKKCGFRKVDFINARTTKVVNSSRS